MTAEFDLALPDGRTLHAYDTGGPGDLTVVWHHGTRGLGTPPEPLFETAARLGIRWLSFDRPGYGGSTPHPGRTVADAATWSAAVADARDVGPFAVMGHCGGGPHALAGAALLPDRIIGAISIAGPAPYGAEDLDWFAGMGDARQASLRAALEGREAKERFETLGPSGDAFAAEFAPVDLAALAGEWSWLGDVTAAAAEQGPGGLIDDDIATMSPWGFDPAAIAAPLLLVHGRRDRIVPSMHSGWLGSRPGNGDSRFADHEGHISILTRAVPALEWLRRRADGND